MSKDTNEVKDWASGDTRIEAALNAVLEKEAKTKSITPDGVEDNGIPINDGDGVSPKQTVDFQSFAETNTDDPLLSTGDHKGFDFNKTLSELPDEAKMMLVNSEFSQNLAAMASAEVTLDPFDDSSVEARIQKEVATRLQEMMKPLQTQYELNQRQAQLEQFKASHPDLETYKTDIAKLLMTDESLNLERAYYIVKGQKTTETSHQLEKELKEYKRAAKEYGLKVGGTQRATQNVVPETVRKQGGYAVYQWLQSRGKAS
jgi:hypothetical protein